MSTMTKTALSDCSYPESNTYNIRDDIDATITRLKGVIDEEASLRKALRELFVKRREEAVEQVRLVNLHLDLVNEEETAFCDYLMKAAASANEGVEGSGRVSGARMGDMAMPTSPIPTASLGNDPGLNRLDDDHGKTLVTPKTLNHGHGYDDAALPRSHPMPTRSFIMEPPRIPANSTHGLFDEPPRSPARSSRAFDPPRSPARSTHAPADEPPRSPTRHTGWFWAESTRSPARSTRGLFDEPPRSPARCTYAFANEQPRSPARSTYGYYDESTKTPPRSTGGLFYDLPQPPACSTHVCELPRSPTRSAHGLNHHPMPISPARSYRGLPSDVPPHSPTRSTRGLPDPYLPPSTGSDVQPFVEPLQPVDLDPPEGLPVVAVLPAKSKKVKKKKGFLKPEPSDVVVVPSPLEVYLSEEEGSLTFTQGRLDRYRENVKTLLQLIEKLEKPGTVTTGPLQKDSGSQHEGADADAVQPIKSNGPTDEDIAIVKKRLADEERSVQSCFKLAQEQESRIASYRRLIVASSL